MNLAFTPEERAFRDEVRAFVRAELLTRRSSARCETARSLTKDEYVDVAATASTPAAGSRRIGPSEFGGPGLERRAEAHLQRRAFATGNAPRQMPFGVCDGGARHHQLR